MGSSHEWLPPERIRTAGGMAEAFDKVVDSHGGNDAPHSFGSGVGSAFDGAFKPSPRGWVRCKDGSRFNF
jgi:hypothetical protein